MCARFLNSAPLLTVFDIATNKNPRIRWSQSDHQFFARLKATGIARTVNDHHRPSRTSTRRDTDSSISSATYSSQPLALMQTLVSWFSWYYQARRPLNQNLVAQVIFSTTPTAVQDVNKRRALRGSIFPTRYLSVPDMSLSNVEFE